MTTDSNRDPHGYLGDVHNHCGRPPSVYVVSTWQRTGPDTVHLRTRTILHARINGIHTQHTVADLRQGPRSGYTSGFLSPTWVAPGTPSE